MMIASMTPKRLLAASLLAAFGTFAGALPTAYGATPFRLDCNPSADTAGWAVDAGRDFDGDGVADVAFSAPCARRRGRRHVGTVRVVSGAGGKTLFKKRGRQELEYFGAAVALVGDMDGDGRAELVVGAPGHDGPAGPDSGMIRVFRYGASRAIRRRRGRQPHGEFGASIAGIGDVNRDGTEDILVGAPGERSASTSKRTGRAYVLSGRRGLRILGSVEGTRRDQRFGTLVRAAGDIDGDGFTDILVSSEKTPVGSIPKAGYVEILSGTPPFDRIRWRSGTKNERLGASGDAIGDIDGDLVEDVLLGVPGGTVEGVSGAGYVLADTAAASVVFRDPFGPQPGARFGQAVANAGDVDGDGFADVIIGAPYADPQPSSVLDAGSVFLFSGFSQRLLWAAPGPMTGARTGWAVSGGIDYDADGVTDLVVGSPGATARGRRGAGTVTVHSGTDGRVLKTFSGIGGLSTRLYAAGHTKRGTVIRSFARGTVRLRHETKALAGKGPRALSMAILNDVPSPKPGQMLLAIAGGSGGRSPTIEVYRLRSRSESKLLSVEPTFASGYRGGVNVAAGDLDGDDESELIAVQADATSAGSLGRVDVLVFERTPEDRTHPFGGYAQTLAFSAFQVGDVTTGGVPIEADGGRAAVGDVLPGRTAEIVVVPATGAPVVRVFSAGGVLLAEWLAYDPSEAEGLNVAVADIDGDGETDIITVPAQGQPVVRAFHGDGTPVVLAATKQPVSFVAFPATTSGATVTAADVDYDAIPEIITAPAGTTANAVIRAFEADGTAVRGFTSYQPFADATSVGLALAATDRFVNK
ncbi:MAG: hypothetical protein D6815_05305 [Candidatus Dadabacteria bacterium]|nr:MAG: hypothetical protein D6815_05305 [Candidatus Dadabacteria bacterium]